MESLRELVAQRVTVDLSAFNDDQIKGLAKSLGLEVPRQVTLEEKYGGIYIQVPRIPYKDAKGEEHQTRQFSIRAEAVDQLIQDLQSAKGLLK